MPLKIDGRYSVLQSLGGHLHLGRNEQTGGQVFLCEVPLPPELGDDERALVAERVLQEARAAVRVWHPAVVPVIDAVLHQGEPWIVTPPINGRRLSEVLAGSGPLPPQRVAALGLDVFGALDAAHTLGVVHGDVQPSNVWVTPDGRAVLTGFGTGVSIRSRSGSSVGTPGFTAPEKTTNPTPASDLWSLGATLYQAVEGVPPFSGDTPMEVLSAVLTGDPRRPRRAGALGPVLLALLARDPAQRPADLSGALARIAGPAPARDRTIPVRPGPFALLTGSFAVAVASVTAIATALLTSPERPQAVTPPPGAGDPGVFAEPPRACDLIDDARAEKLVPSFYREEDTSAKLPLGAHCAIQGPSRLRSVEIVLTPYRPGPLGGGPQTAREVLAGLKAEVDGSDLPGVGDAAISYLDEEAAKHGVYERHAVVVVSNLVADVVCTQREVRASARRQVVKRLGSCAERAAGWVGESLKRAG